MKVSLRWLADYIDLPTSDPIDLARAFASLGHSVEGVTTYRAEWSGVVIAEVLTVAPHPDADKVRVCTVTTGSDPIQVICGAWNFEAGAKVAFSVPGAVLTGGFEIGIRKIRGVESHGMICSERELGLGEEHGGILVLEETAPVGTDFADFVELPDTVFELEITPNRPDAMSMVGIARELAAYYGVTYRRPVIEMTTIPGAPSTRVGVSAAEGCNRFTLREMNGVAVGMSPFWMRRRLRAAGVRPISNIVDVTNYVMLELGHPLHAFDGERVRGGLLDVRKAVAGETMVTLDGFERVLTVDDLVICDAEGPTSLAGTMGGLDSEVVDETTRVLMEAANWDPPTILHMSRRHGLRSEASARFERGVDPALATEANDRAVGLLQSIAGGEIVEEMIDLVVHPFSAARVTLSMSDVRRTLGEGFERAEVARLLESIELAVEGDDPMTVTVPTVRPDLTRTIDLVEEVARLHGLDRFPDTVPTFTGGGWSREQRKIAVIRRTLAGCGLHQALSLSFSNPDDLEDFGYPRDHPARQVVRVRNPLRDEESALRSSLLPGLVRGLRYNLSHGGTDVGLFEVGRTFFSQPDPTDDRIPYQPERLAFALVGSHGSAEWGVGSRPVDFYTASALWRSVAEALSLDYRVIPVTEAGLHPARGAAIMAGEMRLGVIGELHPGVARRFDLPGRVAVGEFDLAGVVAASGRPAFLSPSSYPPVEFDLAFLVPAHVAASRLAEAMLDAADGLVEEWWVFDEYAGDKVEDGHRSLALRFRLRATDRTLTGDEVAPVRKRMVEAAHGVGARLRGQL